MIDERLIVAGFGGQGVMLMGQMLAQAGMDEERAVAWLPSYGPEMRGGTANCMVTLSDGEIASPIIDHASSLIIMNRPSLPKFLPHLEEGGVCLLNSSLVDDEVERTDVKVVRVPCTEIASELGNLKMTNMVMLGAFVEATHCVKPESILGALEAKLGAKKAHLMEGNRAAFAKGGEVTRAQLGAAVG